MWEELQQKPVKVRKRRQCEWCGEPIERGAPAQYRSFIGESGPQSAWSHPECWWAMCESDYRDLQEGWSPGDFQRGKPSQWDEPENLLTFLHLLLFYDVERMMDDESN